MSTHLIIPDPPSKHILSKQRNQHKPCSKCGSEKRARNNSWCQTCKTELGRISWQGKTQEGKRTKWLKHKYKLSYQSYIKMYEDQNGSCKICSTSISVTKKDNSSDIACVDHNHNTGEVRGLLCNHCNRALGLLKEDKKVIESMLRYVS